MTRITSSILISLLLLALAAAGQPKPPEQSKSAGMTNLSPTAGTAPSEAAELPLSNQAMEVLLAQISKRLGVVRSFQSSFVQERHLAIFEDVLISKGLCYFEAPDKFRWELTEPYVSILIFNRNEVGKFDFKDHQLEELDAGAGKAMPELLSRMTSLMRGDFKASRDTFTLSAFQGKNARIVLTPRVKALGEYIRAIELTLDCESYHVTNIVIREPEGDSIQIVFSNVRENVPFARELFDTKNPGFKNAKGGGNK